MLWVMVVAWDRVFNQSLLDFYDVVTIASTA